MSRRLVRERKTAMLATDGPAIPSDLDLPSVEEVRELRIADEEGNPVPEVIALVDEWRTMAFAAASVLSDPIIDRYVEGLGDLDLTSLRETLETPERDPWSAIGTFTKEELMERRQRAAVDPVVDAASGDAVLGLALSHLEQLLPLLHAVDRFPFVDRSPNRVKVTFVPREGYRSAKVFLRQGLGTGVAASIRHDFLVGNVAPVDGGADRWSAIADASPITRQIASMRPLQMDIATKAMSHGDFRPGGRGGNAMFAPFDASLFDYHAGLGEAGAVLPNVVIEDLIDPGTLEMVYGGNIDRPPNTRLEGALRLGDVQGHWRDGAGRRRLGCPAGLPGPDGVTAIDRLAGALRQQFSIASGMWARQQHDRALDLPPVVRYERSLASHMLEQGTLRTRSPGTARSLPTATHARRRATPPPGRALGPAAGCPVHEAGPSPAGGAAVAPRRPELADPSAAGPSATPAPNGRATSQDSTASRSSASAATGARSGTARARDGRAHGTSL